MVATSTAEQTAVDLLIVGDCVGALGRVVDSSLVEGWTAVTAKSPADVESFAGFDCLVCDRSSLEDDRVRAVVHASSMATLAVVDDRQDARAALEYGVDDIFSPTTGLEGEDGSDCELELELLVTRITSVLGGNQPEQALADRHLLQSAILVAAEAGSFDDALSETLRVLTENTDAVCGEAWVPARDGLTRAASWCAPEYGSRANTVLDVPIQPIDVTESLPGRVFETTEPQWERDIKTLTAIDCPQLEAAIDAGFRTAVSVPIESKNGIVAVITVFLSEVRGRDERLLELLAAIAAQLGSVLIRRRVEDHLRRERALQKRVFETSPVGILLYDESGGVIEVNGRAETILSLSDDHNAVLTREECPIRRLVETNESVSGEDIVYETPEGERRWLTVNAAPIDFEDEPERRTVVTISDVTQRKRHERTLQQQRERLTVLHRVLRHDIRTSATLLLGYADEVHEHAPSESLGDNIAETARRMSRLSDTVRHLTDAIRADSAVAVRDVPVTLERSLERFTSTYPDVTVKTDIDENATIEADANLGTAFDHILENAAVHADDPVSVRVTLERTADEVLLAIEDDGPGIPDDELQVLERGIETPLEHSSGLGLWLTTWIVDAAGGSLSFDTDVGTTVTIRLPLASTAPPDQ